MPGVPLIAFVEETRREAFRADLQRLCVLDRVDDWRLSIQPRGRRPTIEVTATVAAVRDCREQVISLRWLLRDMTEHLRAEDEIRDLNGHLEQRVAQRTAQLETAILAKDEFLAILGHELRDPLEAIDHALAMLRHWEVSPTDTEQAYDIMDRQVQSMTRVLDDLLDLGRITHDRVSLACQRELLSEIIERAASAARPLFAAREQSLQLLLGSEPMHVDGNAGRLEQVFLGLLTAAAQTVGRGGQMTISAQRLTDCAVIRLHDLGSQVTSEMLTGGFDSVIASHRALDRSHDSFGIALTIIKRVVEWHGGSFKVVDGRVDGGAEFVVRLPLSIVADVATQKPPGLPDANGTGRVRILIVDDNRDAADTLAFLLKHWGYSVQAAYDGEEALSRAEEFRPDILLLDIGLPKLNGYRVAERLRLKGELSNLRIVALTGFAREEDQRRAAEAGCDHHLVKPIQAKILQQFLASLTV